MNAPTEHDGTIAEPTLRSIVADAMTAPSFENCQPWSFLWDGARLAIEHDSARSKQATFHMDHLVLLNLGMLLEVIDVAASRHDLAVGGVQIGEPAKPGAVAVLTFSPSARPPDPLFAALRDRHTDRRRYAGGTTSHPAFQAARSQAQRFTAASLHLVSTVPEPLVQVHADGNRMFVEWKEMATDLARWFRYTDEDARRTNDGLTWRSLNWTRRKALVRRLYAKYPLVQRMRDALRPPRMGPISGTTAFRDCAALGLVTVDRPDPASFVEAGRLAVRTWLVLNANGMAMQPLTNSVANVHAPALASIPPRWRTAFEGAAAVFRQAFDVDDATRLPVFFFRAGIPAAPMPREARTLRRSVDDVLHRLPPGSSRRTVQR